MPWEKHSRFLPTLLGILLSTTAPLSRAIAQTVGSVTAVNQTTTGSAPGTAPRRLSLGDDVIFKEKIVTSAEGSTQLGFIDRSTLNIGRNSSVVIDEFVYKPAEGTGAMSITLSKGLLRFVGGQVSHTAGTTITTPVAVVGVRGGSATVATGGGDGAPEECKGTLFVNHVGALTVHNNVDQMTITQAGYGVCIVSPDLPIPPPFFVTDAFLKNYTDQTTSSGGQNGGAPDLPSDQMADRSGVGNTYLDPPGNPPGNPFDILSIINQGDSTAGSSAQGSQQGYGSF